MSTELVHRKEHSLPVQVLLTIKGSFLLSFATLGLLLVVLAAGIPYVISDEVAGIVAASGLVIFVINVVGHFIYKLLERSF